MEKIWNRRNKRIFDDAETFLTNRENDTVIEIGKKLIDKIIKILKVNLWE